MFRWLRSFTGAARAPGAAQVERAQDAWIEARMHDWQGQWHDLFDEDGDLAAAGEFERPAPLPDDVFCDDRLIFGLSRATPDTRQKCFALFPSGAEMYRRFDTYLTSNPIVLSEAEARVRLRGIVDMFEKHGASQPLDLSNIRVINRETEAGLDELRNTDDIAILLEERLPPSAAPEKLEQVAAELFLTEPLHAAAGNFYQLRNWVTSAMKGGLTDALHTELYALWSGGWQAALSKDGLILAAREI